MQLGLGAFLSTPGVQKPSEWSLLLRQTIELNFLWEAVPLGPFAVFSKVVFACIQLF